VYNILAPGGVYICISHGLPEMRLEFLKLQEWSKDMSWNVSYTQIYKNKGKKTDMPFEEIEIKTAPVHYVYVCRKKKKRKRKVK